MSLMLDQSYEAQSFVETGVYGWRLASASLSGRKNCVNLVLPDDAGLFATNPLPNKRGDSRRSQLNCRCDSAAVVAMLL